MFFTSMLIFCYLHFSPLFEFIVSNCYSMSFLLIYLSFHFDSLVATLIPRIFSIFIQIPCIPTLIPRTRILFSFLAFPPLFSAFPSFCSPIPPFWNLQIACSVCNLEEFIVGKQLLWFKNEHYPLLLLHNPRHQINVYNIYDAISVITKKIFTFKCLK